MDTLPSPVLDRVFRGHEGPVRAVKFNPNMQQIVSCGGNAVFVWHFKKQLRPHQFEGHKAEVTDVCVSQNGSLIASSSRDKTIRLWKNLSRGESTQIKGHTGPVRSVCFSSDDGQLLTSSDDKIIKIWSTESRKFQSSLDGHTNWVRCARFAPDRTSMVASCGDDKTVKVWDTRERKCTMSFAEHVDAVNKVLFHPDGSCIAACGDDNSINLWDIRAKRLLQHYDAHAGPVSEICFDDGGGLLSTSFDQTIKLWDLREGNLVYTTQGHDGPVFSCAFSPKKGYFVTGGQDCMVHVWKSGFPSPENIGSAALLANANNSPRKDAPSHASRTPAIRDVVSRCAPRTAPQTNNASGPAATVQRPMMPTESAKEKADSVSPRAARKPLVKKQESENVPRQAAKDKEIVGVENAELQKTLQEMSAQMNILVQTVKLLEARMRMQEQQIDAMATAMQKKGSVLAQEATDTAETLRA